MKRSFSTVHFSLLIFHCSLFALHFPSALHSQHTYYVMANGNNVQAKDGLSEANAWKTLNYALDRAESGSTVVVGEGTFTSGTTYTIPENRSYTIAGRGKDKTFFETSGANRIFYLRNAGLVLKDVTLRGASIALTLNGAAIFSENSAVVCERVDMLDNSALAGAAMYVNGGAVRLSGCNISGNRSLGANNGFGALNILSNTYPLEEVVIARCLFANNTSRHTGSAIRLYLKEDARVTIQNSTFTGNHVDTTAYYGTVYISGVESDAAVHYVEMLNNTIAGNTSAGNHAAGVYTAMSGVLSLINNILVNNTLDGIHLSSDGIFLNMVMNNITDRQAGYGADGYLFDDLSQTISYANICGSNIDGLCDGNLESIDPADLKLQAPADNGGDVPTMALGAGSIAIDAGMPDVGIEDDQRGYLRDEQPDIGAYEYDATLPTAIRTPLTNKTQVAIYPNPAEQVVRLETDVNIASVRIFSASGRKVMESGDAYVSEINVSHLHKGNYFICVTDEWGVNYISVMIKK
jgi:hypothetical protein